MDERTKYFEKSKFLSRSTNWVVERLVANLNYVLRIDKFVEIPKSSYLSNYRLTSIFHSYYAYFRWNKETQTYVTIQRLDDIVVFRNKERLSVFIGRGYKSFVLQFLTRKLIALRSRVDRFDVNAGHSIIERVPGLDILDSEGAVSQEEVKEFIDDAVWRTLLSSNLDATKR
ncbi:9621_t:CDS:2, partial [Paraglomus brasilianum]